MATPEEKAVKSKTPDIINTIVAGGSATLTQFAGYLVSLDVIKQTTWEDARQDKLRAGTDSVMTAVKNSIRIDPAKFKKLIEALRKSELNDEANMLEREYCEFVLITNRHQRVKNISSTIIYNLQTILNASGFRTFSLEASC